jgi:hypothetical protein
MAVAMKSRLLQIGLGKWPTCLFFPTKVWKKANPFLVNLFAEGCLAQLRQRYRLPLWMQMLLSH